MKSEAVWGFMKKRVQSPLFWGSFTAVLYIIRKGFHVCAAFPSAALLPC